MSDGNTMLTTHAARISVTQLLFQNSGIFMLELFLLKINHKNQANFII